MVGVQSKFIGKVGYQAGLKVQADAGQELERSALSAVVLGLEHDPVITLGVRGQLDTDLRVSPGEVLARGFEVVKTNRGGQATLHNHGQLVIYPICDLKRLSLGTRDYVCLIEKSTAAWLTSLGVSWERQEREPGIFVGGKKLVALGFRISHGKTSHGIAINVSNRLEDFELIRTCGISNQPVTSLSMVGLKIEKLGGLEGLFAGWMTHFNASLENLGTIRGCRITPP
jgi:lipoyl(octanoyl) transferase